MPYTRTSSSLTTTERAPSNKQTQLCNAMVAAMPQDIPIDPDRRHDSATVRAWPRPGGGSHFPPAGSAELPGDGAAAVGLLRDQTNRTMREQMREQVDKKTSVALGKIHNINRNVHVLYRLPLTEPVVVAEGLAEG